MNFNPFLGGDAMATYRFYIFENDTVAAPPRIYDFPDNASALAEGKKILNGSPIEIWRNVYKVARLEPPIDS